MILQMNVTKKGRCPDSPRVKVYEKGETYSVPDEMPEGVAAAFKKEGWAEEPKSEKLTPDGDNKLKKGASTKRKYIRNGK